MTTFTEEEEVLTLMKAVLETERKKKVPEEVQQSFNLSLTMDRPFSVTLSWLPNGTVNGVKFDMDPRPVTWSKDLVDCFRRIKFNEKIWLRLEGLKPDEPDMFFGTEQGFVIKI
ncbi:hypothetical protein BV898_18233 [Hypsibius exemplaris]|uniref:Uncharacterized protein n=1 Tax=Hypsibius exemplaris TaxID=2072580 RepID=A0A9X6RNM6_HYPEX|nr:hypothetical protein BV898_18233 [Hypsibius exemplaris]